MVANCLTVKVLEVGQFYPLTHAQDISRAADTIEHHPHVTSVEGGNLGGSCISFMTKALEGMLDICPRSDNRAEDHQSKGEEGHSCDGAAKP